MHAPRKFAIKFCSALPSMAVLAAGIAAANVIQQRTAQDRLLLAAVEACDARAADAALQRGANPNGCVGRLPRLPGVTKSGKGPPAVPLCPDQCLLDRAIEHCPVPVMRTLLQHGALAEPPRPAGRHQSVWEAMKMRGREAVALLLDYGGNPNPNRTNRPLIHAMYYHDLKTVRILVAHNVNVNLQEIPVMVPCLALAAETKDRRFLQALLDTGPDINLPGVIAMIAHDGDTEVLRMLLDLGAKPDTVWRGCTPLLYACADLKTSAVQVLLEHRNEFVRPGADIRKALTYLQERARDWTTPADKRNRALIKAMLQKALAPEHSPPGASTESRHTLPQPLPDRPTAP